MINVGVIGCGYWGPNLIRNFNQLSEVNMSKCCDLDSKRLNHIKALYPNIVPITNYSEVLKDPEIGAVAIATPVHTHFKIAKEALLHDKHIFVEKPITTNSEQAEELIELASKRGKILMVGHTFEYTPAVNKVKELISQGEIGEVYYINSTRVNLGLFQTDINVIWDLAPHDISILLYMLNVQADRVSARGESYVRKGIEDVGYLTLRFPNKVFANLHVSWLDPCKLRKMTIVGSKKMMVYDDIDIEGKIRIYDKGVSVQPYYDTFGEFQLLYRSGDMLMPKLGNAEPLGVECAHFIECIREKKNPRSDGLSGLRVVKVLEAATRSIQNGGVEERIT